MQGPMEPTPCPQAGPAPKLQNVLASTGFAIAMPSMRFKALAAQCSFLFPPPLRLFSLEPGWNKRS